MREVGRRQTKLQAIYGKAFILSPGTNITQYPELVWSYIFPCLSRTNNARDAVNLVRRDSV